MAASETTEHAISILDDLVAFPTVSSDSNLGLIHYAANRLDALGARVEIHGDETGTKANLFATLGPETDGGVVLSGHTDVVPVDDQAWSTDPFKMTRRDGRLYGRGTCDMKGYIAAALAAAPQYAASKLARPVHFAFTYDEEVGCFGAQALMAVLADSPLRPSVCIIGEPTMMQVIEGHKGDYEYTVRFLGLEGHGSQPDRGVNAVEYAVRYISRLLELQDLLKARTPAGSPFDPAWTTIQVGRFDGGAARNVIPNYAEIEWEMRPAYFDDSTFVKVEMAEYVERELLPAMRAVHPDADIVTETVAEVDGLLVMPDSEAIKLTQELTGETGTGVVPFGTEAGLFQKLGISTVVCGPGSVNQAHKADEFLEIDQLDRALDMLRRLTAKLGK